MHVLFFLLACACSGLALAAPDASIFSAVKPVGLRDSWPAISLEQGGDQDDEDQAISGTSAEATIDGVAGAATDQSEDPEQTQAAETGAPKDEPSTGDEDQPPPPEVASAGAEGQETQDAGPPAPVSSTDLADKDNSRSPSSSSTGTADNARPETTKSSDEMEYEQIRNAKIERMKKLRAVQKSSIESLFRTTNNADKKARAHSDDTVASAPNASINCEPTLFQVTEDNATDTLRLGDTITPRDVLNHVLRSMSTVQYGSALSTPFTNPDGRIRSPTISAPGADAGQLLLAISALEQSLEATETKFTDMQVAMLVADFVVNSEKQAFVFQTDAFILDLLCMRLKFCPPQYQLDNPPAPMMEALRLELIKPEMQGCGYFRNLLLHDQETELGVNRQMTEKFIIAFFNLLWGVPVNRMGRHALWLARSRLKLLIVEGKHEEQAALHISASRCPGSSVPMLTPFMPPTSISLIYTDVADYARLLTGRWMADTVVKWGVHRPQVGTAVGNEEVGEINMKELATSMTELLNKKANHQYQVLARLDAARTPVFHITWPSACCGVESWDVEENAGGASESGSSAGGDSTFG